MALTENLVKQYRAFLDEKGSLPELHRALLQGGAGARREGAHDRNLAYTGKAAREMALATGSPGFTINSFLNAASKFALQKQNSELPIVEARG